MSDPRVFFASERTLLAWIRTGLTVMAFGFVVARFGVFLDLVAYQKSQADVSLHSWQSKYFGLALIISGVICILASAFQHTAYMKSLPVEDLPPRYNLYFAPLFAILIGLIGVAVSVYLLLENV